MPPGGFCMPPAREAPMMVVMDIVAVVLALITFLVLYVLIFGIERI